MLGYTPGQDALLCSLRAYVPLLTLSCVLFILNTELQTIAAAVRSSAAAASVFEHTVERTQRGMRGQHCLTCALPIRCLVR